MDKKGAKNFVKSQYTNQLDALLQRPVVVDNKIGRWKVKNPIEYTVYNQGDEQHQISPSLPLISFLW